MNPNTTPSLSDEALTKLIDLVTKASGPDRHIDASLFAALPDPERMGDNAIIKRMWPSTDGTVLYTRNDEGGTFFVAGIPHYTASIDAALALMSRVLPGQRAILDTDSGHGPLCALGELQEIGATLPLAIIAALLRALQSRQSQ